MRKLLITGTDTDVGKTWVSCLLLKKLHREGYRPGAYKPVCSGAVLSDNGESQWHDVQDLAQACGWQADLQRICPQTFQAAVAPNIAAAMEDKIVDDTLLLEGANAWQNEVDVLIVEGAGGLLCPLSDQTSVCDLAEAMQTPIVIVAANKLGMINHTLLTLDVARQRGLQVAAVIVNDAQPAQDDLSRQSNIRQLQHWLPDVRILSCDFGAQTIFTTPDANSAAVEFSAADLFSQT